MIGSYSFTSLCAPLPQSLQLLIVGSVHHSSGFLLQLLLQSRAVAEYLPVAGKGRGGVCGGGGVRRGCGVSGSARDGGGRSGRGEGGRGGEEEEVKEEK